MMQKKLKVLGMSMMVFALTTAVGASLSTETASAAKKTTAKTLKLKKKKLTMKVGEKKTLKVTVKPKNAKLKWKTSKKKIATVSKKGKVSAKKKGTAKITVTSGKKKATCKVTVKNKYNVKTVEAVNSHVVRVTLNKEKALTAADFKLQSKERADGSYNKSLQLNTSAFKNTGNKTYDLVLAHPEDTDAYAYSYDNAIYDGEFVQVTVDKLNGTKSKETMAAFSTVPINHYVEGMVGEYQSESFFVTGNPKGMMKDLKVNGTLPAGIAAKVHPATNEVEFYGTPTAIANGTKVTITGTDEKGRAITQPVFFYIADEKTILTYVDSMYRTFLTTQDAHYTINIVGGSGSYKVSSDNKNELIQVGPGAEDSFTQYKAYIHFDHEDAYIPPTGVTATPRPEKKLAAGNYTVTYTVTDSNNLASAATPVQFTAVDGVKVSGTITRDDGTAQGLAYYDDEEDGPRVSFSFDDTNHQYRSDYFGKVSLEEQEIVNAANGARVPNPNAGKYEIYVLPNKLYSIAADYKGASTHVENTTIGAAATMNFKLPLYKVTATVPNVDLNTDVNYATIPVVNQTKDETFWFEKGVAYLSKGMYKPGNKTFNVNAGKEFNAKAQDITLKGNFTVNAAATVPFTTETKETVKYPTHGDLVLNDTNTVNVGYVPSLPGEDVISYPYSYVFQPTEDGKYAIKMGSTNVTAYLYDYTDATDYIESSNGQIDDDGNWTVTLDKTKKYVLQFRNNGSSITTSTTVNITKVVETPDASPSPSPSASADDAPIAPAE